LADMPRTMQALQKADLERQYSLLNQQREQMGHLFDQAVKLLRDEAKVELLQKSNEPDSKGWNDQADALESAGRTLFMENSDMKKLALASLLAPMADAYRKLWLTERALRLKTDKTLDKRYGSEPTLSDSGGNTGSAPSFAEDLKQPFSKLFMRELQKQAGR